MTNNDKALETLVWVDDYIKSLSCKEWNSQNVIWTIMNKVEQTLKGMENENN